MNWQVGDKYLTNENRVYEIDTIDGDRLFCITDDGRVTVFHLNGNAVSGLEKLISMLDKPDTTYLIKKKTNE